MKHRPWLAELRTDVRGVSTMEYAVLLVVIVVATLALWVRLGKAIAGVIN